MFFKKHSVRCWLAATAAVMLGVLPARAGSPKDLIEIIPQDAWGFLMVRSLATVDEKTKLIKETLALPMLPDQVSQMALGMFDLGDTVDTSSPICAVMLDAQKFGGQEKGPQNAAVLLIPAKDPKVLLEKLQAKEPQDGVSACTMKGEPAFAAVRNKIVILGPSQDSVTHLAKTKKTLSEGLAKSRQNIMNDSDFYFSIAVGPIVNAYKDMFMPMAQMMMAAQDPEGKSIKQLVKLFSEVSAFDVSIGVDEKGLSVKMLVCPVADSDLQKWTADEKNTTDALLAMLPKEKYLFSFGGLASQSEHKEKFGDTKPLSGVMKMMNATGIDAKAIESIDEEFIKLQKAIKRYAVCISALPEGSDGLFGLTIVAEVADSKAFVDGIRELYKKAWKASEDENFVALKKSIVHKADGETVGDQKVDSITVNVPDLAERSETPKKEVEKFQKIMGKDCVFRFGAVDDKHIAIVFGGGPKRYESVCGAVKSKGDSLSGDQGIVDLSNRLPSPRASEAFIAVDSILQSFKTAAKLIGEEEFPIEAPTLNAPLAFAFSVHDKSVGRYDCVVPMKLIKAVKSAVEQYSASAKDENFDEDDSDAGANDDKDSTKAEHSAKPAKAKSKAKAKKSPPSKDEADKEESADEGGDE